MIEEMVQEYKTNPSNGNLQALEDYRGEFGEEQALTDARKKLQRETERLDQMAASWRKCEEARSQLKPGTPEWKVNMHDLRSEKELRAMMAFRHEVNLMRLAIFANFGIEVKNENPYQY